MKVEAPVEGAEAVHQSLSTELAFDIFLVLDGCEVRFVLTRSNFRIQSEVFIHEF